MIPPGFTMDSFPRLPAVVAKRLEAMRLSQKLGAKVKWGWSKGPLGRPFGKSPKRWLSPQGGWLFLRP